MTQTEPDGPPLDADPRLADGTSPEADVTRQLVEHWGIMARGWGINATMGELFALLYVSGTDWTAEALQKRLRVSRGNVSMNLRELITWGIVHKVRRQGERREYYRAEAEVWTLFRRITVERKRRELDPTLDLLDGAIRRLDAGSSPGPLRERVERLRDLFALVDSVATRFHQLDEGALDDLRGFLDRHIPPPP